MVRLYTVGKKNSLFCCAATGAHF